MNSEQLLSDGCDGAMQWPLPIHMLNYQSRADSEKRWASGGSPAGEEATEISTHSMLA